MQYSQLGKVGILISKIGIGCWPLGGETFITTSHGGNIPVGYSNFDEGRIFRAIKFAIGQGVNLFDTSDVYGNGFSEKRLSKIIVDSIHPRKFFCIVTKGGTVFHETRPFSRCLSEDVSKDYLEVAIQGSLKRLKMDYIDVYLLHTYNEDIIRLESAIETLREFRDNGLIRAYGVSIHSGQEEWAEELIVDNGVDVLEVPYSLLDQKAARRILPLALEYSVGIIARSVLCFGILTDGIKKNHVFPADDWRSHGFNHDIPYLMTRSKKFRYLIRKGQTMAQAAIRFSLSHPAVSAVIVGIMDEAETIEDLEALGQELMSQEYERAIKLRDD